MVATPTMTIKAAVPVKVPRNEYDGGERGDMILLVGVEIKRKNDAGGCFVSAWVGEWLCCLVCDKQFFHNKIKCGIMSCDDDDDDDDDDGVCDDGLDASVKKNAPGRGVRMAGDGSFSGPSSRP
jgi:hypothetical protein